MCEIWSIAMCSNKRKKDYMKEQRERKRGKGENKEIIGLYCNCRYPGIILPLSPEN